MTLLHPGFLALAALVPLVFWVGRRARPNVAFSPALFARSAARRSWRVRLVRAPGLLQGAGLLLAVVALARPVRSVPLPHTREGIDIVFCVDTSSSMTGKDMDPQRTRLDVAKESASRFLAGRPNDRVGLVSFARYPDLVCPPTLDHEALGQFLTGVAPVPGDGPEDATGIGTAVARAADVLRGGAARARVVILLTDGEENVATDRTPEEIAPLHAGQLCRDLGVRVYAIAAGLGRRRADGAWTALDTRQVRRLAETTGGRFFEARDAGAAKAVYAEIDALEKADFAEPRFQLREEYGAWLTAAVLLLVFGRLFQATVLRVQPWA